MSDPRHVPWAEIRRAYETTAVGLDALARTYGFASKTTIRRRRDAEGWVRNPLEVEANLVTRAVVGTPHELPVPPAVPPPVTRGSHGGSHDEPQQNRAPAAENGSGVPAQQAESAGRSQAVTAQKIRTLADRVEDLAEIQAQARREHLRQGDTLTQIGTKLVQLLTRVIDGPADGESWPLPAGEDGIRTHDEPGSFGAATRIARSVSDKDSIAALLKTAVAAVDAGVKITRQALGMDQGTGAPGETGGQSQAGHILSAEQMFTLIGNNPAALELLADTSRHALQMRPDVITAVAVGPGPTGHFGAKP